MPEFRRTLILIAVCVFFAAEAVTAQDAAWTFPIAKHGRIEVLNNHGRVEVVVAKSSNAAGGTDSFTLKATSASFIEQSAIEVTPSNSSTKIRVRPKDPKQRIDLVITVPEETSIKVETEAGEVLLSGAILSAEVKTDTGTIAADVPTNNLRYLLRWTASRPRFVSDFELSKIKERSAGRFEIAGTYQSENDVAASPPKPGADSSSPPETKGNGLSERSDKVAKIGSQQIDLKFETARGIILINVPPGEVSSDLRERPLTDAAKAIIRSGDSLLMEAIRRAAPRYYGDYLRTLPPLKLEPRLAETKRTEMQQSASVKTATVRVSDQFNRAVSGLSADDFEVIEAGNRREVLSVRPLESSFNLVLLLDVSGSIENYVDFIRKAARSFVNTVDARDRIAIVTFGEDVQQLSGFSTDKVKLSESLDSFDAGGPTAYYDSLAFVLADTLRPLKGERTAIVVLTDGDDNRSFLAFDSMLSSIQESGALIYPLYVPSGLIEASHGAALTGGRAEDSLRRRYLQGELTSKAKGEGARLAEVSGGVYYQIDQLSQIDKAYQDIVDQLKTAYEIEYRSELSGPDAGASPRLRIRTVRPNSYVQIHSVISKVR